jgi:hypothetical protein
MTPTTLGVKVISYSITVWFSGFPTSNNNFYPERVGDEISTI